MLGDDTSEELTYEQQFQVSYEYPVVFTRGIFRTGHPTLRRLLTRYDEAEPARVLAVLDQGLCAAWPNLERRVSEHFSADSALELLGPPLTVPGGEAIKADGAAVATVHEAIANLRMDRHAWIMAVGGGAVLDVVGFAASTAHRGLRLLRIPTTVLAQNDSGVGVKNGLNAYGQKNFLGAFAPPNGVINDRDFLRTLEPRDQFAGMAEAVKVALVRDAEFFDWLEAEQRALAAFSEDAVGELVRRCAELHLQHIATTGDPFERDSTRPLDYGHWAAHKLELLSNYRLRHGEAVAIGMALDSRIAVELGLFPAGEEERVCTLLKQLRLPVWTDLLEARDIESSQLQILAGLDDFRQHLGGVLSVTLLTKVGRGVQVNDVPAQVVERAVAWLRVQQYDVCSARVADEPTSSTLRVDR